VAGEEVTVDAIMGASIIEGSWGAEVEDIATTPLESMTVAKLTKFAKDNDIELEAGMLKDEILFFIKDELKARKDK
jgi:hypothetical protein